MIGDQAKRALAFVFVLLVILAIGGGFLVWRGLRGPAAPATPVAVTATIEAVKGPAEAADLQPSRTPEPTTTKKPEEFTSAADAGLPAGHTPLGQPGGRQVPNIPAITPHAPPTGVPALQAPGGGKELVDIDRLAEGVKKAAEQAQAITEWVTGPTPTPTPRGGILNTGVAAGVSGWVWVGVFILIAILALVATGIIGIERA